MDISELNPRQIENARTVYLAALPFGTGAAKGALMAVAAESSYLRYANDGESQRPEVWAAYGGRDRFRATIRESLNHPHDAVAGKDWTTADSLGLFQQRPMYKYGSIAELMDPSRSTTIFLSGNDAKTTRAFLDAPQDFTLAQRVQWTQGSEFPTGENYRPMETVAQQLITRFGGALESQAIKGDELEMATLLDVTNAVATGLNSMGATLVVRDNDSGWHYSIAPGHFQAVGDQALSHGTGTGVMRVSPQALNWIQLVELRNWAFSGKGNEAASAGTASGVWRGDGQFA